jgi:serine protease AprX
MSKKKKSKSKPRAADKAERPELSPDSDVPIRAAPTRETASAPDEPALTPVPEQPAGLGSEQGPGATKSSAGSTAASGAQPREGKPVTDPHRPGFLPDVLDSTVIARPLLKDLEEADSNRTSKPIKIIIDLNLEYPDGRDAARERAVDLIKQVVGKENFKENWPINRMKTRFSKQYIFCQLSPQEIRRLVSLDQQKTDEAIAEDKPPISPRSIFHIWPDFKINALLTKSISTVKCDAARNSFSAMGEGIVWAVIDSGIDSGHPHFEHHKNLELTPALEHCDFTDTNKPKSAEIDEYGHGTHVAGIIAGEVTRTEEMVKNKEYPIRASTRFLDEHGRQKTESYTPDKISGMAPRCKLLSLKVLDDNGAGEASNLIAAMEYIQEINGNGRRIRVHGVNMSVGYDFEPEWFACGQSPVCVEVDRLVKSGVVVVVAAGNSGYGAILPASGRVFAAGIDLTINDPGNAELAITVGSTHRYMPHVYGVSYFSSKGPTGDGRLKPDLVAPGEKIISCKSRKGVTQPTAPPQASTQAVEPGLAPGAAEAPTKREAAIRSEEVPGPAPGEAAGPPSSTVAGAGLEWRMPAKARSDENYEERSGTSMAAPHVSGVIAAFLSIRSEFIGKPEAVKEIFLSTATDLKRVPYFQGRGLVDLMRAIQSV